VLIKPFENFIKHEKSGFSQSLKAVSL